MGTQVPPLSFTGSAAGRQNDAPVAGFDPLDLLESEKRALERIAHDAELKQVLDEIARIWEKHAANFPHCVVLTANDAGDLLQLAAAPSLPRGQWTFRDGTRVGPDSNACGVAGWNKRSLLVEDAAVDARLGARQDGLLAQGMRAGWVEPMLSSRGRLLGAIAVYSASAASPTPQERLLMERLVHFARIAIERDLAARDILRLSDRDVLTGLPNRSSLLDALDGVLLHDAKESASTAVLLFSLNAMQQVNDALGYEFGSRCIKAMAARLGEHLSNHKLFARIDGPEFGVVVEGAADDTALEDIALALLQAVSDPLRVDEHDMFLTACVGISLAPRDGTDADTLFKHADAALHRAKQRGRNCFCFYSHDMDAASVRRLKLLGELRQALKRHEFRVHYQPQVELATGRVVGAEALLRWERPEQGPVPTAEFIPLLEETGLILAVGGWVLEKVCSDLARLDASDTPAPRIGVNLSARQFLQPDLAEQVERHLAAHGLPAEQLLLEITETLLMQDPVSAVRVLERLRAIRVGVALDDFGTGYSSLDYLKRFPVDELKVDKSFVTGVTDSAADAAITDAVIRLAHNLGIRVVAEGVETEAQLAFLKNHGCDLSQGYLTGRPLEFDAFRKVLSRQVAPTR